MTDQLLGWLSVVVAVLAWLFPRSPREKPTRRRRRTVRYSRVRLLGVERVRLDATDDDQS